MGVRPKDFLYPLQICSPKQLNEWDSYSLHVESKSVPLCLLHEVRKWKMEEEEKMQAWSLPLIQDLLPVYSECALSVMLFIQTPLKSLERLVKRTLQGKKYLPAYGKKVGVSSTRVLSRNMRDHII